MYSCTVYVGLSVPGRWQFYVPRLIFDNVLPIFVDGQVPKGVRRQKKTLHY